MFGWKTWLASLIIASSAVLHYLGYTEESTLVLRIGESLGLIGLGHKIIKLSREVR